MCVDRAWGPDNAAMKERSLRPSNIVKRTRKHEFLDAMELVAPKLSWPQ